jgi:multiple sugar transport system permease protein
VLRPPTVGSRASRARHARSVGEEELKGARFFPENKTALIVVLVGLAFLALFWWYPLFKTFLLGFRRAGLGYPEEPWVGLAHYRELLRSAVFGRVVVNTFHLAAVIVPAQIVLGLAISTIIFNARQRALQRIGILCFYTPYVLPVVAIGILWKFLYHPSRFGVFNFVLSSVGIGLLRWLEDPRLALSSIALMQVWQRAGYVILIYFAGMQSIPSMYYEAAEIDGATAWQKFRGITLPLLVSTTLFVVVTTTISAFMTFESIYVMTLTAQGGRGGPANATNVMLYYVFNYAFDNNRMGYASAAATILFLMILGVTLLQFRYIRQRFEY